MSTLVKQNKSDKRKIPEKKSHWISFILYPDDRYHLEYLDYLKTHNIGFYILHGADSEGIISFEGVSREHVPSVKPHYHVTLYFESARYASGFIKSLPVVKYQVTERDEFGDIKSLSSNLSNFDSRYYTIEKYYDDYVMLPIIKHAEAINDIYAQCHYIIHDNFECHMQGKKLYSVDDVRMLNNDRSIFMKHFIQELPCNDSIVSTLIEISKVCGGDKKVFTKMVLATGDTRLLKYLESHSYFISEFIV